ncbi:MAG: DUF4131 domain-containing protein [Chloroflexi bacterium]|nr:DUF4131 domain-containing protein [Chloroflexota bacterium]
MPLVFFVVSVVLGVLAARGGCPGLPVLLACDGAGLCAALLSWRLRRGRQAAAVALGLALGATRYALALPAIDAGHLAYYNDAGRALVRAWVAEEPLLRGGYTQLTLEAISLEPAGQVIAVRGRLLADVPLYPAVEYGDVVLVEGLLASPAEGDGASYGEYLAQQGVLSRMPRATVMRVGSRPGAIVALRRAAGRLKTRARAAIDSVLPNPEAGLLSGMLLGLDHTLPADLQEAFRRAGLTHIIVISGYNIGLVLTLFLLGRHLVRRQVALSAGVVAIGAYAQFVGTSPPVARAALMGIVFALGPLLGRRSHSLTALDFATLVMVAANPLTLWSVSFQLSLAATLGLLLMERRLAEHFAALAAGSDSAWRRAGRLLGDGFLCTVVAQAATLPVIWHHFGELSVVSPLSNALVLWLQPALLVCGAAAALGGLAWLPLGRVLGWLAWPALRLTLLVVEWSGRLPWASASVPRLGTAWVWAIYAALALGVFLLERTRERRAAAPPAPEVPPLPTAPRAAQPSATRPQWAGLAGLGLLAVALWGAGIALPDGRTHVTFLDVGQGDAVLIRSPGGRTVLVDGGPDPTVLLARLGRALPFWQRSIDVVVATHADADHLTGLLAVLERYEVGAAVQPPGLEGGDLVRRWDALLAERGIPRVTAWRGWRAALGDGQTLEALHPDAGARALPGEDLNPYSLVLRVEAEGQAVLLTADIDADAERRLLATRLPLGAAVLKVAHHGAGGATSEAFLSAVRPAAAIISVGSDNTFGHPAPAALDRLRGAEASIWRTDLCGAIDVAIDEAGLQVHTARPCEPSGRALPLAATP